VPKDRLIDLSVGTDPDCACAWLASNAMNNTMGANKRPFAMKEAPAERIMFVVAPGILTKDIAEFVTQQGRKW
jgi:hypothetical protein